MKTVNSFSSFSSITCKSDFIDDKLLDKLHSSLDLNNFESEIIKFNKSQVDISFDNSEKRKIKKYKALITPLILKNNIKKINEDFDSSEMPNKIQKQIVFPAFKKRLNFVFDEDADK